MVWLSVRCNQLKSAYLDNSLFDILWITDNPTDHYLVNLTIRRVDCCRRFVVGSQVHVNSLVSYLEPGHCR